MREIQIWMLVATVVTGLSACGGDGGNAAGLSCASLAPLVDGANATNNCVAGGGCSVDNAGNAADGKSGSAATLSQNGATSGYVAVDVKASGGGMFAAGTRLGVIYEASASSQTGFFLQLNTYLVGAMQDSFNVASDNAGSPARPIARGSFTTTRPYDTVEFRYVRASGSSTGIAKVYELCAD